MIWVWAACVKCFYTPIDRLTICLVVRWCRQRQTWFGSNSKLPPSLDTAHECQTLMIELNSAEILVNRNAPLKCSALKFEAGCFGIGHHFVIQNSLFLLVFFLFLNQHIHKSLINHHNKNCKFGFHFLRPNNDQNIRGWCRQDVWISSSPTVGRRQVSSRKKSASRWSFRWEDGYSK